jgi:hypothetical protein
VSVKWDFAILLTASPEELLAELADAQSELANLHEEIAFNKVGEVENHLLKAARIELEGRRAARNEKKLLLVRLLDARCT